MEKLSFHIGDEKVVWYNMKMDLNTGENNAKQTLLDVLDGKTVSRIPFYTLIPYTLKNNHFIPGAFHGFTDIDDWRTRDPLYMKLVNRMELEGGNFFVFRPSSMDAQNIFISPMHVKLYEETKKDNKVIRKYSVTVGKVTLTKTEKFLENTGHSWITEHFCKSVKEAQELLNLSWSQADDEDSEFSSLTESLGNRGVFWVTIPSPVMTVCRLFDPQDFLLFTALYRNEIDQLMLVAFERTRQVLISLLEKGYGPVIRFGGAEHATPPMMSPADFDWLVFQYDKPLMDLCKKYHKKTAVHCHGNIRHAVKRFMEMGVDQLDPVETYPYGDISMEELRKMTEGQITLTGNIQCSELSGESPEHIKKRVHELISQAGPNRLIISTTGTPLEKISEKLYDNYMAIFDSVR